MTEIDGETPEEAILRNLARLKTEGVDAATEAAIALLRDPKAPAQAKSATINAVFRASGLLEKASDDSDKPGHEMTLEEIQAAALRAKQMLDAIPTAEEGIFE